MSSFFKNKEKENIFTSFLQLLNVKHTAFYSSKVFRQHPHKHNMFGLSNLLSSYGVENAGIRIQDKETDLFNLEAPFIAHVGSDFSLVTKVTPEKVHTLWKGEESTIPMERFLNRWSGVVLLADPAAHAGEPEYSKHKKEEIITFAQRFLLLVIAVALFTWFGIKNQVFQEIGLLSALVVNSVGIYISYLLVLKQMHLASTYADKICSLFNKYHCNDVLESDASKFLGKIPWSEIGISYFISNLLIIILAPSLITYMCIINVGGVCYSFWSIWYQKVIAKQWCPLCLIVQIVFWALFAVSLVFSYLYIPKYVLSTDLFLLAVLYVVPFLLITQLIPVFNQYSKVEEIQQEIEALKSTDEVFAALLKKQAKYPITTETTQLVFGNPNAKNTITIFSNPHCEPCGKMHWRIKEFMKETKNQYRLQYLLSAFDDDLTISNRFMVAAYLNNDQEGTDKIYDAWYTGEKLKKEDTFAKYAYDLDAPEVMAEFNRHEAWKEKTKMKATPTIFFNGYILPDNYKLEDLKFFSQVDLGEN